MMVAEHRGRALDFLQVSGLDRDLDGASADGLGRLRAAPVRTPDDSAEDQAEPTPEQDAGQGQEPKSEVCVGTETGWAVGRQASERPGQAAKDATCDAAAEQRRHDSAGLASVVCTGC